jgi:hypothetical protein
MTDTITQTTRPLTPAEMQTILEATAERGWTAAIIETFKCFGVDMTDKDGPKIRPGDYKIPEAQWGQIGDACAADGPVLGRVNHLLDWGNYGPSAYKP